MDNFIYFTDPHFGAQPLNRCDNYNQAILKKLEYIFKIAKKNNATILCGGDLFNTPKIKIPDLNKLFALFADYHPDFYCLHGNESHDGLIESSPMTAMKKAGFVHSIERYKDFESTRIVFLNHGDDFEFGKLVDKSKINILMTHLTLVKDPIIFDHILFEEFDTDFEIVTVGHYHPYQGIIHEGNTRFIAPGALARIKKIKHDIEREPKFVHIKIGKGGYSFKEYVIPHEKDVWVKKTTLAEESVFENAIVHKEVTDMKSIIDSTDVFSTLEDSIEKFGQLNEVDKSVIDFCIKSVGAI